MRTVIKSDGLGSGGDSASSGRQAARVKAGPRIVGDRSSVAEVKIQLRPAFCAIALFEFSARSAAIQPPRVKWREVARSYQ